MFNVLCSQIFVYFDIQDLHENLIYLIWDAAFPVWQINI